MIEMDYTLQGTSRTSSTNPSSIMKQIEDNAALYSTSHCQIQSQDASRSSSTTSSNKKPPKPTKLATLLTFESAVKLKV